MSWVGIAAFVAMGLAADAPSQQVVLGMIPVEPSAEIKGDVSLEIVNYAGTKYGELSERRAVIKRAGDTVQVDLRLLARAPTGKASARYRRCTFAVDCTEQSVLHARDELVRRYGSKPALKDIERFVSEFITTKSLAFALTPASVTATAREGDCTEHAMLFTALARLTGHAARFVDGFVLIESLPSRKTVAVGHAWAEVHDGKRWQRFDPALLLVQPSDEKNAHGPERDCVVYVPMRVLDDEGPGFGRLQGFDVVHVKRVLVNGGFHVASYCR